MRKFIPMLAASVLMALALPALAADAEASVQDCWKPAFLAADADAVAQCYAEDAVLFLPGAPKMEGREAIRAGYADFFAHFTIKSMTLAEAGHQAMGDHAASWGAFTLVTVSKEDGKETTEVGRYTDVSRKQGGRWVYVVDHASDDPPPAPAG
jgi:uncharacterized protein (TIGR02246 family)